MTSVLVAGIGNIFLADDGFGVEVAGRLTARPLPDGVEVVDSGIRGLHLAYQLLDGYDVVIFVDTVQRGDPPGTISVLEIDGGFEGEATPDAHDMSPETVLSLLADLGGTVDRLLLVGLEPAEIEERIGLSDVATRAVDDAVKVVEELIKTERRLISGTSSGDVVGVRGSSRDRGEVAT